MINKVKLILCAYNSIGIEVLNHIILREDIEDIALYTHIPNDFVPDIRKVAKQHGIWSSTENLSIDKLPFKPDIISSVYYRNIIRPEMINFVKGKIFNIHPSLLPRYRGCSSIPWAIIKGDNITGITYHYIDKGIDTGDVILQAAIPITDLETQKSLYEKCMKKGAEFWPAAFELVKMGLKGVRQDEYGTSYNTRSAPNSGQIDDNWPSDKIERFIRAMIYPPYPPARYKGSDIYSIEDFKKLTKKKNKL